MKGKLLYPLLVVLSLAIFASCSQRVRSEVGLRADEDAYPAHSDTNTTALDKVDTTDVCTTEARRYLSGNDSTASSQTLTNVPIGFDDGTVLVSDDITVVGINSANDPIESGDTEGGNPYVWYSVADAPLRSDKALKVQTTVANYSTYKGPAINITTTDESSEGNIYTLDFDIFVQPPEIINSSRVITQLSFGGSAITFSTYGSDVRVYATSAKLGTKESWIGIRVVYTVTVNGQAAVEIFSKDADGNYVSKHTVTVNGSSISTSGVSNIRFSSYSSGMNQTYYLDNISFTRSSGVCEHTVTEWTTTTQPTCVAEGEKEGVCTACGDTVTDTVPALGHTEVIDAATEPTCTESGLTDGKYCSVCDEVIVEQQAVAALGHELVNVSGKEATCTEAGYSAYLSCTRCSYTENKTDIAALGHNLSDWVDTEGNMQERSCQNTGCDYVETRENITNNVITFDDGTVLVSDDITVVGINSANDPIESGDTEGGNPYVWYSVADAPLRSDKALKVQTTVANYSTYKGPAINITTTDESSEGNIYTLDFDIFVQPPEIINSSRVITQLSFGGSAITFSTYGSDVRVYATSAKLGTKESWIGIRVVYTVTVNGQAAVEIFSKDADGNYVSKHTVTVNGSSISTSGVSNIRFSSYSSGMNQTYYLDNISFTRSSGVCEHTVTEWTTTTQPTCVAEGEKEGVCTACGDTVTDTVPALGHTEVIDAATEPTCTESGLTEGKHCSVCDEVIVEQQTVAALGHDMGEWTGVGGNTEERECSRCDHTETRTTSGGGGNIDDGGWT